MLANYYVLRAVVRELGHALMGTRCQRIYCFRKDELRLAFSNGDTVVALLTPVRGALYLTHDPERLPKRNVASFFPELAKQELTEVSISDTDREISLSFGEFSLVLTFFGSPNAVLSKSGEVISSFKRLKRDPRRAEQAKQAPSDSKKLDLLGKRLTAEHEAAMVENHEAEFLKNLQEASGVWLYELKDNVLLSPMELRIGIEPTSKPRFFVSPSDGIRRVLQERHSLGKVRSATQAVLPRIEQALYRTSAALTEIERAKTHTSRSEDAQEIGKALLVHLNEIPRGASKVMLELADGPREVKLDPKLSATQNVDKYFDRAKRSREAQIELLARTAALERERAQLEQLKAQATRAEGAKEIEEITAAFARLMDQTIFDDARAKAQADQPFAKFRRFTLAGGLPLLVGKSAAQNDELTLHVAKKEDIWLHARGVAGSHAVLQTSSIKGDQVPREAIEQAAQIAAYFSDAKTQSLAPVSFTRKKYVRKPKGAAPGAVMMEREEVILVRPGLPKDQL